MEELTHILIFKTNIESEEDKRRIQILFKENTLIEEWSVDCEDVDCVLRVVSYELSHDQIIKLISEAGFYCEELE